MDEHSEQHMTDLKLFKALALTVTLEHVKPNTSASAASPQLQSPAAPGSTNHLIPYTWRIVQSDRKSSHLNQGFLFVFPINMQNKRRIIKL